MIDDAVNERRYWLPISCDRRLSARSVSELFSVSPSNPAPVDSAETEGELDDVEDRTADRGSNASLSRRLTTSSPATPLSSTTAPLSSACVGQYRAPGAQSLTIQVLS